VGTHANSASTRAFLFDKDLALLRARRDADLDVFRLGVRCPTLLVGDEDPSKQKGACPLSWLALRPSIFMKTCPLSVVTNPIMCQILKSLINNQFGCWGVSISIFVSPFVKRGLLWEQRSVVTGEDAAAWQNGYYKPGFVPYRVLMTLYTVIRCQM
jgi:hypothetical protein